MSLLLVPLTGIAHADIYGTEGDDKLRGNDSSNTIYGGRGGDTIAGFGAGDNLYGGEGNDTIKGGEGNDLTYGGPGRDTTYGGSGADNMNGGDGNDHLYADSGRDVVEGDEGDDVIYIKDRDDYDGPGDVAGDVARGGGGDDEINARDGERDQIACGPGLDLAVLDFEDRLADDSCERVQRDAPLNVQDSGKEVAQSARDWALLKEGVAEQPLGSDSGPQIDQWQEHANAGHVAWCGIFAHEAYLQAGLRLSDGVAYTDWLRDQAAADSGHFQDIAIRDIRPGDIVILDWPNSGDSDDHIAIVTKPYVGDGRVATISGNYSNQVMRDSFPTWEVAIAIRVHL